MIPQIDAPTLKGWLSDGREIALLDVREHGQYGEGHPFFAVPLPYSRFEIELPRLVPNLQARLVLLDAGDGVADRAGLRAKGLGYRDITVLAGGAEGWRRAGYTLYAGVNLPSKTFGEMVEHARHTPRITAAALEAMRKSGEDFVIVDGRPFAEYRKMSIPGGICCPNGELALRIKQIAPDTRTKIIVNCAGRTRSIIGAQTLIDFGIDNPVLALENGTQGWFLAGLSLEHGASRRYPDAGAADLALLRGRARKMADRFGVGFVGGDAVAGWLTETSRTTFLLDVRTAEDVAEAPAGPAFVHAAGGQLIQATDQWVGVKGARIVLADADEVRAPVVAAWLRQLGHEAWVLSGGLPAARRLERSSVAEAKSSASERSISVTELAGELARNTAQVLDLRPSMSYRKAHIEGARWAIRSRLGVAGVDPSKMVVLIADEPQLAALAAVDLGEMGCRELRVLDGGIDAWQKSGRPIVATPNLPTDGDCIDFLFFVHDRHDGNPEAMRAYLSWETGLLAQLDEQERGVFRIVPADA